MKAFFYLSVRLLTLFALSQMTAIGQSNFLVTPSLGFQVSFPVQDSYQYQISSSTNLTNWSPVTDLEVSCGGMETFSFGMTNGSHAFYRAEVFPPNLTNRIVGLTNVFFDNAVFQGQGASMTVSGLRVQSQDYNLNDYIKAQFQFDLCTQSFSLTSLNVITNLGLVCGQSPPYFIKDATNQLLLTNGLTALAPDVANTITVTGQVMTVNLQSAQVFDFKSAVPVTNQVIVTDPNGNVILFNTVTPATWFFGGSGGFLPGTYGLQFIPQGIASESITLYFHNDNGRQLSTLTNGMNIATSIGGNYSGDYAKFKVSLTAGQVLQLNPPGTGADLYFYNSLGVLVSNLAGATGEAIFTAPVTGTYYVIYACTDYGVTHNYSTPVSITP